MSKFFPGLSISAVCITAVGRNKFCWHLAPGRRENADCQLTPVPTCPDPARTSTHLDVFFRFERLFYDQLATRFAFRFLRLTRTDRLNLPAHIDSSQYLKPPFPNGISTRPCTYKRTLVPACPFPWIPANESNKSNQNQYVRYFRFPYEHKMRRTVPENTRN